MFINSVMLKLKNKDDIQKVKDALLGLKGKIDELVDIQVETNVRPGGYDLVFFTRFKSLEDLEAYIKHPVHMEAGKPIVSLVESQASVCYEAN
jgi:hypothetical protein